ncbi:MAG: TatD family hydrolase [Muribaculaceae bacterium]|nr:TatD family hydrolase [Muribaculaceae bacterium]
MIDTHTHLYLPEFDDAGQAPGSLAGGCAAVDRAVEAGVQMMIFPNVDLTTIEPMKALHALRPECTAMAMGLHPTEVKESYRDDLASIRREFDANPHQYIAVGEVGIDLYWDRTFEREQMDVFDAQTALAVQLGLPVVIHCREGLAQVLEVLESHPAAKAVFHSFGGTEADVDAIRRRGDYYFGINGIATFRNSKLASVLPYIGIDRLLTETDSPYLAPTPHRGRRNESAYIPLIVSRMAEAVGSDPASVAAATTRNAKTLFNIL